MREGPQYLPHSWRELALWMTLVILGAFGGRFVMVHVFHISRRWA